MHEEEKYCSDKNCKVKTQQEAIVCVPVTVTPYANVGEIVSECCGAPIISYKGNSCKGIENGSCSFTISQKIRVQIPVDFGADTTVGGTFVDCECIKDEKKPDIF